MEFDLNNLEIEEFDLVENFNDNNNNKPKDVEGLETPESVGTEEIEKNPPAGEQKQGEETPSFYSSLMGVLQSEDVLPGLDLTDKSVSN